MRHARRIARPCILPAALLLVATLCACPSSPREGGTAGRPQKAPMAASDSSPAATPPADPSAVERARMVAGQLRGRNITDPALLTAMERVARHEFVPREYQHLAYSDGPLPIGYDQTISQPYIVALMTQLARPQAGARALDIGTGSGYQAAVLAELVGEVYSIEILCPLAEEAADRLERLGYDNVTVRCGDGYRGWPEHAPFDLIILAAAPDHVPQPLVDQLAPGGRLVLPVGDFFQELVIVEKMSNGEVRRIPSIPVRFVPMTGESQDRGTDRRGKAD